MTGLIPPRLALRMTIVRGITILNPPVTAGIGVPYSHTFRFFGGTAPITSEMISSLPSGWSYNAATHTLSNPSPDTPGPVTITLYARDDTFDYELTQAFTFNVVALPLTITNAFGDYTAGVAQSFDYTTSGGAAGAKTFAVTSGALPPGLSLSSAGHISGNTNGLSVGTHPYTFGVTATDTTSAISPEVVQTVTVTVVAISITNSAPAATQGTAYSFNYIKSGGTGAVTWSKQSGTLPPGLSLSSAGLLSGMPTTAGTYAFVVAVTDNAGTVATRSESISVAYPTLTMTGSAPIGEVGIAYSFTPTISGGNGVYTVTVSSGSIPAWASLNSTTGAITGTPTTAASTSFTLHCVSGDGQSVNLSPTVTINAALALSGTAPTPKNVGDSFSWTPTTTGGVGTVVYSVGSGSLPPGTSLNTSTGAVTGTITGTGGATSTFVIHATDSLSASANTASQSVFITDPIAVSIYNKIKVSAGGNGDYWDLTESSGTRAGSANGHDLSVIGTNGTETGPRGSGDLAWYAGSSNVAYLSTSRTINDALDVPASTPGPQNYCLFGWMKFHSNAASVCPGGTYAGASAPGGEYFWWMKTTGGISGYGGNSSNNTWVTADGTLPDTTSWHFYCLWRDATDGKLRIQIDGGTPVVSSSVLTTVAQSTLNFNIGGANNTVYKADVGCSRWGYMKGSTPTSAEITWLRNSGNGRNWAEIKTLAGH